MERRRAQYNRIQQKWRENNRRQKCNRTEIDPGRMTQRIAKQPLLQRRAISNMFLQFLASLINEVVADMSPAIILRRRQARRLGKCDGLSGDLLLGGLCALGD